MSDADVEAMPGSQLLDAYAFWNTAYIGLRDAVMTYVGLSDEDDRMLMDKAYGQARGNVWRIRAELLRRMGVSTSLPGPQE